MPPTPAERLVALLTAERAAGVPFLTAWPPAVEQALASESITERTDWQAVLRETRPAWAAAWAGEPATRVVRALSAVADDPERVALQASDGDGRYCELCDGTLRATADVRALYCSKRCRQAAHLARKPLAA
ncbi:MAG: hypothetical protein ACLGI5_10410 [Thermoleophilia bacterium]